MKKRSKLWIVLGVLVFMQLFRLDTSNPPSHPSLDFFAYSQAENSTVDLIKMACYDCHSYKTEYPWYVQFSPISWWMNNHVKGGRKKLNFSVWHDYNEEEKKHKIGECIEEINDGSMPIKSYKWMHSEAKWSEDERKEVIEFLQTLKNS